MKNFKNFYLNYTKGTLCKQPLVNAKNYFYDFFKKNITETAELARLNELINLVDAPEDVKLVKEKIQKVNDICVRNEYIFKETESKIKILESQNSNYHEIIYQAAWLKNILKYYPNQEEYVLKDYGIFVTEIAKLLNSQDEDKIIYRLDKLISFFEEYKFAIRLTIESLKSLECKLIKEPKVNHAIQMGYEAYLIGGIKKDGVVAALLSDALQYSSNAEKLQARVSKITQEFNGAKVLNIYYKTGQKPELLEKSWEERKKHQLNILTTPGSTSFSALVILLIGKKITLYEISKHFENFEKSYISKKSNFPKEEFQNHMAESKSKFWHEYASITQEDAKKYYSDLAYVLNKIQNLPEFLFDEYEDYYFKVFDNYPIF